jgi:flagella basal body P-ring formation protein FlgA
MMTLRSLLLVTLLLALGAGPALAQNRDDVIAAPVLRANVNVTSDVVRIGDVIDNAGPAAQIAIYRAPDLGTTGKLPVTQLIATLRSHQVIGVDTRDLREISVTRLARTLESKDVETQVGLALEHRSGLGDAANLSITFDIDPQTLQLDASNSGALQPIAVRYDQRSGRFDITFQIDNDIGAPTRLRFTGIAIETVEAAIVVRAVEHGEVLKSSDVIIERRPKAEVGNDVVGRDGAVGMQARKPLRAGQALRVADLAKPDLVQRDQAVTLVYQSDGLYLTIRGKAQDSGTEGDVVNVLNLQSKRTVSGVVTGRSQVTVSVPSPHVPEASAATATVGMAKATAPVSIATVDNAPVSRTAE